MLFSLKNLLLSRKSIVDCQDSANKRKLLLKYTEIKNYTVNILIPVSSHSSFHSSSHSNEFILVKWGQIKFQLEKNDRKEELELDILQLNHVLFVNMLNMLNICSIISLSCAANLNKKSTKL